MVTAGRLLWNQQMYPFGQGMTGYRTRLWEKESLKHAGTCLERRMLNSGRSKAKNQGENDSFNGDG